MFTVKKNKIENGHDCWGRSEFDNVYDVYHNDEFVCCMMSDPTELINKVNNIVKKERGREKMKFSEAFEAMKQGGKSKVATLGWVLVLGSERRNDYDPVQTAGNRTGRVVGYSRDSES